MSREDFVKARQDSWREYERLLGKLARRGARDEELARFPDLYRQVCQDLALVRHRQYGAELARRLNALALAGHERMYRRRGGVGRQVVRFVSSEFPRTLRKNARLFGLANLLFYGPFLAMLLASWFTPDWIHAVVPPEMVANLEEMYDPANDHPGRGRDSGSDVMMFGFYIYNNVGIAFRTFATGILAGVGSLFFLIYNGLVLGACSGHINRVGFTETFYPFVVGHGSFELTAIVISGAAGLKFGFALLSPGRRSRLRALVEDGREALKLAYGAGGMLFLAAFVEGFWSASSAPPGMKYAVGAVLWSLVAVYFLFAGRSDELVEGDSP
jgi:uncharacterized membrane protein SpoIIM required for sporulation